MNAVPLPRLGAQAPLVMSWPPDVTVSFEIWAMTPLMANVNGLGWLGSLSAKLTVAVWVPTVVP